VLQNFLFPLGTLFPHGLPFLYVPLHFSAGGAAAVVTVFGFRAAVVPAGELRGAGAFPSPPNMSYLLSLSMRLLKPVLEEEEGMVNMTRFT